eukprot:1883450-Rhodomonas_salina.1
MSPCEYDESHSSPCVGAYSRLIFFVPHSGTPVLPSPVPRQYLLTPSLCTSCYLATATCLSRFPSFHYLKMTPRAKREGEAGDHLNSLVVFHGISHRAGRAPCWP